MINRSITQRFELKQMNYERPAANRDDRFTFKRPPKLDLGTKEKTLESSLLSSDKSLMEEMKDEVGDSPAGGFISPSRPQISKGQKTKE